MSWAWLIDFLVLLSLVYCIYLFLTDQLVTDSEEVSIMAGVQSLVTTILLYRYRQWFGYEYASGEAILHAVVFLIVFWFALACLHGWLERLRQRRRLIAEKPAE